jgi:hypothetical protein
MKLCTWVLLKVLLFFRQQQKVFNSSGILAQKYSPKSAETKRCSAMKTTFSGVNKIDWQSKSSAFIQAIFVSSKKI